jgi:membrane protein implicated in regulation of membrane protease activity
MVFLFFGEWWQQLTSTQQVFWGIALIFSVLFIIQFVVSLLGLDFDHDADLDVHTDLHVDQVEHGYGLDTDFTLLSVRSIIAFFTFFGWTGVIALNSGSSTWLALAFASLAGLAAMFVVGYMVYLFAKLGQEGNIDVNHALFNTGEVYLPIPANRNGLGKVTVNIDGSLREIDAITEGIEIPTGSSVRVIEVLDDNLLLVEPVEKLLQAP